MLSIKLSKTSDDVPRGSARYAGTNSGSSTSVVIVAIGDDESVEVEIVLRECLRGYAECIKGYVEGVSTKGTWSLDVIDKCRVRPLDWARAEEPSA